MATCSLYKRGLTRDSKLQPIVSISNLSKTYSTGYQALKNVSLDIQPGEILALLGPNGAGKTTLISIICGIVNASSGSVTVGGHDNVKDYRITRSMIGLVPQELTLGAFDKVWNTLCFSRGLFGKKPDPEHLERVLKDLSLWDKKKGLVGLKGAGYIFEGNVICTCGYESDRIMAGSGFADSRMGYVPIQCRVCHRFGACGLLMKEKRCSHCRSRKVRVFNDEQ